MPIEHMIGPDCLNPAHIILADFKKTTSISLGAIVSVYAGTTCYASTGTSAVASNTWGPIWTEIGGGFTTNIGGIPIKEVYTNSVQHILGSRPYATGGQFRFAEPQMWNRLSASGANVSIDIRTSQRSKIITSYQETTWTEVGKQLTLLRHFFSLNTTDLSRVLLVERPTIYAWISGKWEPNNENRARIANLYQLARSWRESCSHPIGKFLREPLDGGLTLMDQLTREPLDTTSIGQLFGYIRNQINQAAAAKQERSIGAIAKNSGFETLSPELQNERFDQVTRF